MSGAVLLEGKTVLVTGLLTERSIAWATAREAQIAGATVLLTGYGRTRRLTERAAQSLPQPCPVLELDVTRDEDFAALPEALRAHCDSLDGALHAVAWAADGLSGGTLAGDTGEVARMIEISAFSYRRLADVVVPMMRPGGSLVGLTFSPGVAWPGYDWMGVAKAALEGLNRTLAAHLGPLGIRTNLVASGPITSVASEGFERFENLCRAWEEQAPLGWDSDDATAVARAVCALLSDWTAALTGGIVHADGGYHAVARPAADSFGAQEPARSPEREGTA